MFFLPLLRPINPTQIINRAPVCHHIIYPSIYDTMLAEAPLTAHQLSGNRPLANYALLPFSQAVSRGLTGLRRAIDS